MAFRKKATEILKFSPDILVIPECEHLDKLIFETSYPAPNEKCWFGKNVNKGLGIFAFGDLKINVLEHNANFEFIIPLRIFNDKISLIVLAVWTQKPVSHDCYTEQVWNAVHYYDNIIDDENVIILGDFNSNAIWDKPRRVYNHTNLVNILMKKNILSVYHFFHNQQQGKEDKYTLYMNRNINRPYHVDYCFTSQSLIEKICRVELGIYERWIKYSDHMPLIIEFKFD